MGPYKPLLLGLLNHEFNTSRTMHQMGHKIPPKGSSCGTLAPGSATHGAGSPQSAPTVMERGAFRRGLVLALDIQNPPVIPGEDRCLEALKAEPQEMFGGSNTSSIDVWMSRVGCPGSRKWSDQRLYRMSVGDFTRRNTSFISRWNKPLILTIDPNFLEHPSGGFDGALITNTWRMGSQDLQVVNTMVIVSPLSRATFPFKIAFSWPINGDY